MHRPAYRGGPVRHRGRHRFRATGGQPGEPITPGSPDRRPSRDRVHSDRPPHHHLRVTPKRHHSPAQPHRSRPQHAIAAVLGKPGADRRTRRGRTGPKGSLLSRTEPAGHGHAGVQADARDDSRPCARGDPVAGQRHLRHVVRNHLPRTDFRRALQVTRPTSLVRLRQTQPGGHAVVARR